LTGLDFVTFVEVSYLNTHMCMSESSLSHENRVQSADSAKACSKLRAFLLLLI